MSEKNALQEKLRQLPAISEVLQSDAGKSLSAEFGEGATKLALRRLLQGLREELLSGKREQAPEPDALSAELRDQLVRFCRPEGRRAINAAGILLHTGLGRAPLSADTLSALAAFGGYSILQTSLDTGARSLREEKIEAMLRELTGCEAATVVNNNAAATMLILNTLASGREVVISRGQLIEIGGAFRMTDVMGMSGATLREVGCTNRTHVRDYEAAISENTGALIHVHTSNYRVRGFASTPDVRALCEVGARNRVPVIDDLGSGALVRLEEFGLTSEPMVRDSIAAGSAVVCFSGDKLICGTQSGIICGAQDVIGRIRKNPFARMFRVDKLTLAGLESALLHFVNGTYREHLPLYQMLAATQEELRSRAEAVLGAVGEVAGCSLSVEEDIAYMGSGSIPDEGIPTTVIRAQPDCPKRLGGIARSLRMGLPSVFCRVQEEALLFDMRTVFPEEIDALAAGIRAALGDGS